MSKGAKERGTRKRQNCLNFPIIIRDFGGGYFLTPIAQLHIPQPQAAIRYFLTSVAKYLSRRNLVEERFSLADVLRV